MAMGRELGGASGVMLQFAVEMAHRNHDVSICSFRSGPVAEESVRLGLPTDVLSSGAIGKAGIALELMAAVPRMRSLLSRLKPDIVHTHTYLPEIFGRPAARLARIPVVVTSVHTNLTKGQGLNGTGGIPGRNWMIPALVRLTDNLADRFYATSTNVQRMLQDRGIPSERIQCLFNEIDCAKYVVAAGMADARLRIRTEFGLDERHFLIGSTGRLEQVKQYDVLIRAVALLLPQYPEIRLLLPGVGLEQENLKALALDLGMGDRVIFPGWRTDIPDLLSSMDVFVLTSRMESSPLSLLEAMAAGRACIATRVGGIEDMIRRNDQGWLVPYGDVAVLADRLLALHLNPALRRTLGANAQSHVCTYHDLAKGNAVTLLLDDYCALLAASGREAN